MSLSPAEQFRALDPGQRRVVHELLGKHALGKWNAYARQCGEIVYWESVCGTRQVVDKFLPADAFDSFLAGYELANVSQRYLEPIVALHEDDLAFPGPVGFAYYAIYNLFHRYVTGKESDDWLIVNQALAAEEDESRWTPLLLGAIAQAR